jgi:hypothetical protein
MTDSFRPDARLLLRARAEVRFQDPSAEFVDRMRALSRAGYVRILELEPRRVDGKVPSIACLLTEQGEEELTRSGFRIHAELLARSI